MDIPLREKTREFPRSTFISSKFGPTEYTYMFMIAISIAVGWLPVEYEIFTSLHSLSHANVTHKFKFGRDYAILAKLFAETE